MSVSAVFVLDVKGRILIYRDYRGDISIKYAEKFMSKVNELEDSGKLSPVICDDGVTYIYLQHSNVYLLAVTRDNVNATAVVLFLHRLVEVFKHYFQELEEESIRDNFVVVYELLDEVGRQGAGCGGQQQLGRSSSSSSSSRQPGHQQQSSSSGEQQHQTYRSNPAQP
jgi:AP-1 complex subunit mu